VAATQQFRVVAHAATGARFRPGDGFTIVFDEQATLSPMMPTSISVRTVWFNRDVGDPMPTELEFTINLHADDVDAAVGAAMPMATSYAAMIAFTTNVAVGTPRMIVAYEITPGLDRRPIVFAHRGPRGEDVTLGRWIEPTEVQAIVEGVHRQVDEPRIARAFGQYEVALRYWSDEQRVLSLAHLYMAIEALTRVVGGAERERHGHSNAETHARALGITIDASKRWQNELDGRIRRDVICAGDHETFQAARKASDGLEHGYASFQHIRAAAESYTGRLFGHVRRTILSVMTLDPDVTAAIEAHLPLDTTPFRHEIRGVLHGAVIDADALGTDNNPHPELLWSAAPTLHFTEDDTLVMTVNGNVTARLADGIQFEAGDHSIYGGIPVPPPDVDLSS
jgi:hypothetical protein